MAEAAVAERIEPTPWQSRVLAVPEQYDLFLGGGRGGGKTYALLLLILRHVETYGHNARVLVIRRNYPDLRDMEAEARFLFGRAYGRGLSFNQQSHLFRFPNGATCQLDQMEGQADFAKYQGKSFSLIVIDEAGQFSDPAPLDLLRSCLRSRAGVPTRMILAANPGGSGHGWLHMRHVAGVTPWNVYVERKTQRNFVTAPSTLEDNPHLDQDYSKQISAATATDPELAKAWLYGDWNIARGAFFGAVFDQQRNVVDAWPSLPTAKGGAARSRAEERFRANNARELGRKPLGGWEFFVAGDHGSSAPAVFYLVAQSPGACGPDGRYYPARSLVLMDEVAFAEKDAPSQGLGLTVPVMAAEVVSACKQWGMRAQGVMDDACFARHGSEAGTLASEYRKAGLIIHPAKKGDRISGWQIMRTLLADAGKPDKPGLYVSENCRYWLSTTPFLDRDDRRPEDVNTKQADHAADATRYACLFERPRLIRQKVKGF
jgi:hypothetical protein